MKKEKTHLNDHEQVHLSRRLFLKHAGAGLAGVSLLSLAGCQDSETVTPRFTTVTPLHNSHHQTTPMLTVPEVPVWAPPVSMENKSRWKAIIVHHTATPTGSAAVIDRLHKKRGFNGLGYDFIINNGTGNPDGLVEVGYRWRDQITGAHCHPKNRSDNYWNDHAIGIALIGNFEVDYPTSRQYASLNELLGFLKHRYVIPSEQIYGHKHVPGSHTQCPGRHFSWQQLTV